MTNPNWMEKLIEYASHTAMKWHVLIGFSMGSVGNYLMSRWESILDAFVLGAVSAIAASLWKMFADWYVKRRERNRKKTRVK